MKNLAKILPVLTLTFPAIASAQLGGVRSLIVAIGDLVQILTVVVAGIALLAFFWGLVKFIYNASAEGKSEGKAFMLWGIIALFVMVSVWGLVSFINTQLAVFPIQQPILPRTPNP